MDHDLARRMRHDVNHAANASRLGPMGAQIVTGICEEYAAEQCAGIVVAARDVVLLWATSSRFDLLADAMQKLEDLISDQP